jgi:DNA/RNA-binding domain of Phe-tRNA-synthetase-like protein
MRFIIEGAIFDDFPDARIGMVSAQGLDNRGGDSEITELLRKGEASLIETMQGTPITEHPRIAPWREAYRKFGARPKKYPSSIENLARRTQKGERLRHINKLVDIYNAISLRHLVPVGGEDLDRVEGDIRLTYAGEDEPPVQLLGEPEPRPPVPGEVIYKDDVGAICRRWNWKEADRSKLTEDTRTAVLVIESLPPVSRGELEAAARELAKLVENHCHGETQVTILDNKHHSVELSR